MTTDDPKGRDAEMKIGVEPAEGRMIFLLQHPLRRRLLGLYVDSAEPLSPKELADYTKAPLDTVALHVRVLRDLGALYLVDVRPVRDAVEHFYSATGLVDVVPWAREALLVRSLREHIEERRKDPEFMERLHKRIEEDRPILEAIERSAEERRKQS